MKTTNDIPGWYDWHAWATALIPALPANGVYVEVGCFLGRSTCAIAQLMEADGRNLRLHAVDTFRLTRESEPALRALTAGKLRFRKQFENNLVKAGVLGRVKVLEMPSLAAAASYAPEAVDVVFIDADHSYAAVRADIAAWWPALKPGGIMAGHDIHTYDSVWLAVHDGLAAHGQMPIILPGQNLWTVRK